jgi:hypothetical protein
MKYSIVEEGRIELSKVRYSGVLGDVGSKNKLIIEAIDG